MPRRDQDLAHAVTVAQQLADPASTHRFASSFRADVLPHLLDLPDFAAAWNASAATTLSAAEMAQIGRAQRSDPPEPLPLVLAQQVQSGPPAFRNTLLGWLLKVPAADRAWSQVLAWHERYCHDDLAMLALEAEGSEAAFAAFLAASPARQARWFATREKESLVLGWCFCLLLVDAAADRLGNHPAQGHRLAELAVDLAEQLETRIYGQKKLAQLRALAHAHLGNALRVRGRLVQAEACFVRATALLPPLRRPLARMCAEVHSLHGAFLCAERSFPAAREALQKAIHLGWSDEDRAIPARSEILLAALDSEAGQHAAAAARMKRLLPRLRPTREPRIYGQAYHALALYQIRAGRPEAATFPLAVARPWLTRHGNLSDRVRLRWLEALHLRRLGRLSTEVAQKMNSAVHGFFRLGRYYSAAVAALELALFHLEQGQTAEVRKLADKFCSVFAREGVEREAQATMLLLHQAAQQDALTAEAVRRWLAEMERMSG